MVTNRLSEERSNEDEEEEKRALWELDKCLVPCCVAISTGGHSQNTPKNRPNRTFPINCSVPKQNRKNLGFCQIIFVKREQAAFYVVSPSPCRTLGAHKSQSFIDMIYTIHPHCFRHTSRLNTCQSSCVGNLWHFVLLEKNMCVTGTFAFKPRVLLQKKKKKKPAIHHR